MNYTPKLTNMDVLAHARDVLKEQMPLEGGEGICTGDDVLQILLGVSAGKRTVHSTCENLVHAPSDATVRNYLNAQLTVERLPEIEDQINAALASQIPSRVFKRPRDTAMDYHEQAYYGKTSQTDGRWVRAAAKNGTTRFYRVATAYVIWRDMRVTLAIRFVLPEDDNVSILSDGQHPIGYVEAVESHEIQGQNPVSRSRICRRAHHALSQQDSLASGHCLHDSRQDRWHPRLVCGCYQLCHPLHV